MGVEAKWFFTGKTPVARLSDPRAGRGKQIVPDIATNIHKLVEQRQFSSDSF